MKYYKAGDVDLVCIKNFANGDVLSAIRNLPTIEVSEDAISRRGIKIRLGKRFSDDPSRIMEIVKETVDDAPSVIPKPKEGEWIEHEWAEEVEGLLISNYECSKCHSWERRASDYCPNCGARMKGAADERA